MTDRNKSVLAVIIVAVAVCGLLGRAAVLRMSAYLEGLDAEIAERRAELARMQEDRQTNEEYLGAWEQIAGFGGEPVQEREMKFTAYLQNLASERYFDFTDLGAPTGRPLAEDNAFQVLSCDLKFYTDLADLVEFLDRLDSSEELLRVQRLSVSRRPSLYSSARRYVRELPSSRVMDLWVEMTVATPAALPEPTLGPWEQVK